MKDKYIAIKEQLLNKWFVMLNLNSDMRQAVAREMDEILEDNNEVHYGQLEAKINDKNELEI